MLNQNLNKKLSKQFTKIAEIAYSSQALNEYVEHTVQPLSNFNEVYFEARIYGNVVNSLVMPVDLFKNLGGDGRRAILYYGSTRIIECYCTGDTTIQVNLLYSDTFLFNRIISQCY